jgi:hypothetical protein
LAYFAAARQYDYGDERQRVAALSSRIAAQFLVPHLSLTVLVDCGGDAEVLAFAGVTVGALVALNRYTLEHVWEALHLNWQRLLLLDFKPELLADRERFPVVVLAANGVRGEQLLDFYRTRDQLERALSPDEAAVLGVNLACWK